MSKGRPNGFTAQQVIDAIKGSGGIKTTIASNLGGVHYWTVQRYIEKYPTVKEAYEAEIEKNLDRAEAVVFGNIALATKQLSDPGNTAQADSGDAKWVLSRLGKHRGYSDKQEVEHTGEIVIMSWGDRPIDEG